MNLSAKSRFTAIMVVTASTAMLLVGALAWFEGRQSLEDAAFTHLTGVRVAKSRQLESYFRHMHDQLTLMSEDRTIISATVKLSRGFRQLGESVVPEEYDKSIQAYYENRFIPALEKNLSSGAPEYAALHPTSQAGRYLQYQYIAKQPDVTDEDIIPYSVDNAFDGSLYSEYHEEHHSALRDFLLGFGYYDIFLVDFNNGDIVYSVAKEADFGTNLLNGPYRGSGLAEVVQQIMEDPVRGGVKVVDFSPYAPSLNAPSSFMAVPVYNGLHVVGILAFQIPVSKIQDIMTSERNWRNEGLGESGETYIVGYDYLMRTDSRFLLEDKPAYFDMIQGIGIQDDVIQLMDQLDTTILLQPVQTEAAKSALNGSEGAFLAKDYRRVAVLSTFSKLDIEGLDWAIISEIDESEAFSPINRLLRRILVSTAIFIPIVAYLSFLLSQGFVRPVQNLIREAKSIRQSYEASGSGSSVATDFKLKGASEYRELGHEMNCIIEKVRDDMLLTRAEKKEYENLVTLSLPVSVAERYRSGETAISDSVKLATAIVVRFADFQTVSKASNIEYAMTLREVLDDKVHHAAAEHGIDVFDEIGMDYVGVCGLTMPFLDHFQRAMAFTMDLFDVVEDFNATYAADIKLNVSLDIGPMYGSLAVDGIVAYDILSDSILWLKHMSYSQNHNTALVSADVVDYLKENAIVYDWQITPRSISDEGRVIALWEITPDRLRHYSDVVPYRRVS